MIILYRIKKFFLSLNLNKQSMLFGSLEMNIFLIFSLWEYYRQFLKAFLESFYWLFNLKAVGINSILETLDNVTLFTVRRRGSGAGRIRECWRLPALQLPSGHLKPDAGRRWRKPRGLRGSGRRGHQQVQPYGHTLCRPPGIVFHPLETIVFATISSSMTHISCKTLCLGSVQVITCRNTQKKLILKTSFACKLPCSFVTNFVIWTSEDKINNILFCISA